MMGGETDIKPLNIYQRYQVVINVIKKIIIKALKNDGQYTAHGMLTSLLYSYRLQYTE